MLGMAAADYQYHNTFLNCSLPLRIIPGTVFAVLAGFTYWCPKIFGLMLNERLGKWTFWFMTLALTSVSSRCIFLGLDGMLVGCTLTLKDPDSGR